VSNSAAERCNYGFGDPKLGRGEGRYDSRMLGHIESRVPLRAGELLEDFAPMSEDVEVTFPLEDGGV